jgi:hypothetical protein
MILPVALAVITLVDWLRHRGRRKGRPEQQGQ